MIYRFVLLSDEEDYFLREINIDADATFLHLHEAIAASVNYDKNQMASFFVCSYDWEKEQEITLIEMDAGSEYDNLVMADTVIGDCVSEEGQKLLYLFDYVADRVFFMQLKEITSGSLSEAECVVSKGDAPQQIAEEVDLEAMLSTDMDEKFYGDEEFDYDELDEESFGDLSFDDETL
jgi:hypothetical protein